MATQPHLIYHDDCRYMARHAGMVKGINSYEILFFGQPFRPAIIAPASRVMNELNRIARLDDMCVKVEQQAGLLS